MELTNYNKDKKLRRKAIPDLSSMMYGKVPPQAKELEEAVLGAIMLEKSAFDMAIQVLTAKSFYVDANQQIFTAMQQLANKNMSIDLLTVVEELKVMEKLDAVGGPYYVTKLTNSVVSSANIDAHCRIVQQKFLARQLIRISGETLSDAYEDSTDIFDLLDTTDTNLSELISGNQKKSFTHIQTGIVASMVRIEELRHKDSSITGIPSGFTKLDAITHGWQPTDLIILAARPSVGKTAIALNIGITAGKEFVIENPAAPKSVGFFSLEMSAQQLTNRALSAESEIWLELISTGRLNEPQMRELYKNSVQKLSSLPIYIDDSAGLNIYELRAKCRRLKNKHNVGLIIIDYLQLMQGASDNRNGNREQEISKISRDLKALAKELQVPVIALSQLSREPEKRTNKMPQLSDLRESGAIEQDADMVMFLYRPEYHDITASDMGETTKGETHVKIAKHRNGSLDTIKLKANLAIQKFSDWEGADDLRQQASHGNWHPVQMGDKMADFEDDKPF